MLDETGHLNHFPLNQDDADVQNLNSTLVYGMKYFHPEGVP